MTDKGINAWDFKSTIDNATTATRFSVGCACEKFKDACKRADKAAIMCKELLADKAYLGEKLKAAVREYTPERVLRSGNRMIVFWEDGTKTIVKRAEDEVDSDYAAFTAALGIKLFGSNSALKRIITEAQKPKKKGVSKNGKEGVANK